MNSCLNLLVEVKIRLLIIFYLQCLGDQMSISSIQGYGGHFGRRGQNCNYCEADSCELLSDQPGIKRCLERIFHQRHMFPPGSQTPFKCPNCGARFDSQDQADKENRPSNMEKFAKEHAGSSWHQPPLLLIEPIKYIVCCLHLLLSLTKLLYKTCILPMLVTEELALSCNLMLGQIGVCIPKAKKVSREANKSQSQRIKFTGAECILLLENWDPIVERLVSERVGGPTAEVQSWAENA